MRILRAVVTCVLLVVLVLVVMSYVNGNAWFHYPLRPHVVTIAPEPAADIAIARERGAEVGEKVGEKVAVTAEKVKDAAESGAVTSKIRAKMILDDHIKSRTIDVTSHGSTVMLTGVVRSTDERNRAVAIARDTDGITRVIDRLVVER
jgi:osmotically-inducible protein OsmY